MHWSERIAGLDRRWIFLAMGLAVIVPVVTGIDLAPPAGKQARAIYDAIEALPAGSTVLVSADYDPGSEAELYPMNVALFHHLARKDLKLVITVLWPQGGPLVEKALDEAYFPTAEKSGKPKRYGVDVVNLGYKTGGQILITKMRESIPQVYPVDTKKTPVADIPAMRGIRSLADIDFFFVISAGTPGTKEWVQQCQSTLNLPMASGCTAVAAPNFFAYVDTGQLVGLLGGLRGASDYEKLVEVPGRGMAGMGAQTFGHFLIVVFIVLGNLGFYMSRRREGRA